MAAAFSINHDQTGDNHTRKSFCQVSFNDIYQLAQNGKSSVHDLVDFLRKKAKTDTKHSEKLQEISLRPPLARHEDESTSLYRAVMQLQEYTQSVSTQQLVLTRAVEEQVAEPLISLQHVSEDYIHTLENEINQVNSTYNSSLNAHQKTQEQLKSDMLELQESLERQRCALHVSVRVSILYSSVLTVSFIQEIGYPPLELRRLNQKAIACHGKVANAMTRLQQEKETLQAAIVSRDEMAMAVSVAYQRAEEERRDQIQSCLKRIIHIERETIRARERSLQAFDRAVNAIDRSDDIQQLIRKHRDPENMHFQGKALRLLDWQWANRDAMEPTLTIPADLHDQIQQLSICYFDQDQVPTECVSIDSNRLERLFAKYEGRVLFLQLLNRRRSLQTNVGAAYASLVECFHLFLTACVSANDLKSAKTAMIMAETFYHIPLETRVYLQKGVCSHRVWTDINVRTGRSNGIGCFQHCYLVLGEGSRTGDSRRASKVPLGLSLGGFAEWQEHVEFVRIARRSRLSSS